MENKSLIPKTARYVKHMLESAEGGHDWWHVYRVWKITRSLLKTEKADQVICELGALLHDIADAKFNGGDVEKGMEQAQEFLQKENAEAGTIAAVTDIIKNISFAGGVLESKPKSPELKVVQDADRLDAIGAIGIARTFNYGGYRNRKLFDPEIPPVHYRSKDEYYRSNAPTINHFHEKLLLLKDLMNTTEGRRMAEDRHAFMEAFLHRFYEEWEGRM